LYINDFADDGQAWVETCQNYYLKQIKEAVMQSSSVQRLCSVNDHCKIVHGKYE